MTINKIKKYMCYIITTREKSDIQLIPGKLKSPVKITLYSACEYFVLKRLKEVYKSSNCSTPE